MILEIFLAAFLIMSISLCGVFFAWKKFDTFIQNNLRYLVTLALGVFIATLFLMLQETIHSQINIILIALSAGLGALFLEIIGRLIPEAHHHHGNKKDECCGHTDGHTINPLRVLAGDAIHNIGDGILLVPAFLIDIRVGIATVIGILIHEFVQEISEFFILKEAGYTTKQALVRNFTVSSTIFIGIGISLLFNSIAQSALPLLIAFAAGSFLFIIIRDLFPHTIHTIKKSGHIWLHIILATLGVILILSITFLVPESHKIPLEKQELDAYHKGLMKS